jgi:hypothetical protein
MYLYPLYKHKMLIEEWIKEKGKNTHTLTKHNIEYKRYNETPLMDIK